MRSLRAAACMRRSSLRRTGPPRYARRTFSCATRASIASEITASGEGRSRGAPWTRAASCAERASVRIAAIPSRGEGGLDHRKLVFGRRSAFATLDLGDSRRCDACLVGDVLDSKAEGQPAETHRRNLAVLGRGSVNHRPLQIQPPLLPSSRTNSPRFGSRRSRAPRRALHPPCVVGRRASRARR
jgi:hypothetical protein